MQRNYYIRQKCKIQEILLLAIIRLYYNLIGRDLGKMYLCADGNFPCIDVVRFMRRVRARYYRCLCSSLRTVSVVIASYSAHISYVEFFFWKDGGRQQSQPFFLFFGSRSSCECESRPVPLNSMLVSHRRSRMMLFSYFLYTLSISLN